jgi:hypothetical protein
MASRRDSEASSASETSEFCSEASSYSSRSSSPRPSSWGRRSSVLADLLSNENTDSPVELICIPGVGGSRLVKPDERGVNQEVYPALWVSLAPGEMAVLMTRNASKVVRNRRKE